MFYSQVDFEAELSLGNGVLLKIGVFGDPEAHQLCVDQFQFNLENGSTFSPDAINCQNLTGSDEFSC